MKQRDGNAFYTRTRDKLYVASWMNKRMKVSARFILVDACEAQAVGRLKGFGSETSSSNYRQLMRAF